MAVGEAVEMSFDVSARPWGRLAGSNTCKAAVRSAEIGAGVAVYLDENHTARRASGWWLVLALVLDTDPFREVGGKGGDAKGM